MLNQILQKEGGAGALTPETNQKLDQILTFLKSPPPIERTDKFAVMIPFDTAPNHPPIPTDENPDDPLHKTYWNLSSLARNGTVPLWARETKDNGQITWQGETVSMEDAPTFLSRLLQYYIFKSIDGIERNSLTVYVGYPAEARAGIEPPNAMPYPTEKLLDDLANNRFFKPFLFRKSADEMTWELKPVLVPKGTTIRFMEELLPSPRFYVRLERAGFFRVEYVIENFVGTGLGSVPKHFVTAQASTTVQWAFLVTMHYEIQRHAEDDFHPDLYVQWADALYAALQLELDESKQAK